MNWLCYIVQKSNLKLVMPNVNWPLLTNWPKKLPNLETLVRRERVRRFRGHVVLHFGALTLMFAGLDWKLRTVCTSFSETLRIRMGGCKRERETSMEREREREGVSGDACVAVRTSASRSLLHGRRRTANFVPRCRAAAVVLSFVRVGSKWKLWGKRERLIATKIKVVAPKHCNLLRRNRWLAKWISLLGWDRREKVSVSDFALPTPSLPLHVPLQLLVHNFEYSSDSDGERRNKSLSKFPNRLQIAFDLNVWRNDAQLCYNSQKIRNFDRLWSTLLKIVISLQNSERNKTS